MENSMCYGCDEASSTSISNKFFVLGSLQFLILLAVILSIILFVIITLKRKKNYVWTIIFSLSLTPLMFFIILGILALIGDITTGSSSLGSYILVLFLIIQEFWYIFLIAFILLIISIYMAFIRKNNLNKSDVMIHEMKLQPEYYDYILNGTKRIEIRLYDEKRQKIKIGDTIKFLKEPELNESFEVKVVDLLRYNSFEEMFNYYDISVLADNSMTKEELLSVLEQFYSKEEQEKYGVLGIKIELK